MLAPASASGRAIAVAISSSPNSSGPIVANGMVVVGSTCQVAGHGCYVTGHDVRNGEELWRNELIPHPGQPGDETWGGAPFEKRWMTGVWGQLIYDPELDLVYYGSSGAGPASEVQRGTIGGTMAGTNTRWAVKPKTGEIVWRHQTLPRDNWDQECTFEMMVINTPVNPDANAAGMLSTNPDAKRGPRKTLTGVPCKTGIAWSFDAATGEFLWAKQTIEQNIVSRIDGKGLVSVNEAIVLSDVNKTYPICPTYSGGRDWPMGAYNPKTNVMFMPLYNACIDSKAAHRSRGDAAVCLQHDQYRPLPGREGQSRPYRCDLGRNRATRFGAGKRASRITRRSSRPAAGFSSMVRRTVISERSMPTMAKSSGRRVFMPAFPEVLPPSRSAAANILR